MKTTKIKDITKLVKQLKPFWKKLKKLEEEFKYNITELEMEVECKTGINGIEFFMCDNEYVGIGNIERTMSLITRTVLEKK